MSTNINHGLPDEHLLQELANQLFKTLPGSPAAFTRQAQQPAIDYIPQPKTARSTDNKTFPAGLPTYQNVSTPPGDHYIAAVGAPQQFANPKDISHSADASSGFKGQSPRSVAGSGISPSAHQQGNEVDLNDPQTMLRDPHFPEQDQQKGNTDQWLPFEFNFDNSDEVKQVLSSIHSPESFPQLPGNAFDIQEVDYYFLNHAALPTVNDTRKKLTAPHEGFTGPTFDVNVVRKDFPVLRELVNGRPLIWLDNAATTQKPRQVIDRISYFYEHENSNIHRAAHELAARATDAYEGAREKVKSFINASSVNEIIFVRGTTEAINLVAKTYGDQFLNEGDEIIISHLEHHANIVPWQQLAKRKKLKIRVIPVDDDGQILLDEYQQLLNAKTKLVSFTHVSNALGTVTPAKQIIDLAHNAGAKVLLDGAQSISHMRIDLQHLDPDFFVFSGHKVFGPTGIGVVYGREALLNSLQPWQGGGNMIRDVTFENTQYHAAPARFEAGTGNIADAVGLGAALDYVSKLGIDNIAHYEHFLLQYATRLMKDVPGLRPIGTAKDKAGVLSFTLNAYSNDEVGQALNREGIAVRTGHHCAQPILRRFGVESSVRPSLAFYNTCADIDALLSVLHRLSTTHKKH